MINFKKYDDENPQIWAEFVKIARHQKYKEGFKSTSANLIFELIRRKTPIQGSGTFKVNNIYRPDYARKLVRLHPEFKGFLVIRQTSAPRKSEVLAD